MSYFVCTKSAFDLKNILYFPQMLMKFCPNLNVIFNVFIFTLYWQLIVKLSSWRKYGKFWKVCLKSLLDSDYEKQLSTKHEHWLFVYKYTFSKLYVFPIELWSDNLKPFRKLVRNAVLYSRRSMQFYFYNWNIFKKHDFKKPH